MGVFGEQNVTVPIKWCCSWGISSQVEQTVRECVCHNSWRGTKNMGHKGKTDLILRLQIK